MINTLSLEDQVIAALRRITRAIDLYSQLLLKKCGLTAPQLVVLQTVGRLQPISVSSVAREVHLGQATVTGILGRLEKRGLVVRARADHDRRSVLIEMTPEGTRLVEEAPSPLQERFRAELSSLEQWERSMILATLQRIASMMDAERIDASPVLAPGMATANEEEVSQYLDAALPATDENKPDSKRPTASGNGASRTASIPKRISTEAHTKGGKS